MQQNGHIIVQLLAKISTILQSQSTSRQLQPNKSTQLHFIAASSPAEMAGAEESTAAKTTVTQPLLHQDPVSDQTQFPLITYNHDPRSFKDLPFLILFLLFIFSTFAFGIFAAVNRNPNSSSLSSYSYDSNSTSCVKNSSAQFVASHHFTQFHRFSINSPSPVAANSGNVLSDLIWVLVITLVLSVPISLGVLLSLRHYTKQVVYATLPFFVVIPIFFNVYWFVACTVSTSCSESFSLVSRIVVLVVVFLFIGVIVWIIVVNWHRIELTVSIIGVASNALWRNLGLFVAIPCLNIGLLVYYTPIVVFLVFASSNGAIVASESDDGDYSCVWKQDSWVPAYYTLGIITMVWSATTMVEAQVYVISGTVAQWYFSKDDAIPRRSIRSSLRNAFGPSSGTICLSGLLICAVRVIRAAVDNARRENVGGVFAIMLRCCVNALLTAVEFLNKFTINFAAITGEAYCSSARMTYELLKRNLLSAVFVETVSTRILGGIIFVLSAIYAIAAWAIINAVTDLGENSYFVALLAWVLLLAVLGFFVHVLENVIDTVYVCYAIDRDKGEVCKQEVHEVYVHLPINRNTSSLSTRTPLNV